MLRRKSSNASEKQAQKTKLSLQRSSSFKDFMKHKPTSPVVSSKEFAIDEYQLEGMPLEDGDKNGGRLGKRWRAITRTMTRKSSKMLQKALAEEEGGSGEDGSMSSMSTDWIPDLFPGQRTSVCSNESEETLHSPLSRQLSGCGDRQSVDSGYSQRDSVRLEENGSSYNGPFCGRARVHTDFTPSPYDIESLKLQKGDIIMIIEKPPVGTWTGKLNNKVGSFKFIYVTILPDEATPPQKRRQGHGRNHKSKPKTLEEVLERIGLTELGSLLSMHGFQSLDDFRGLKDSHLNELSITDPEQRAKILTAADQLLDSEDESDAEDSPGEKPTTPRDSGCFEGTETLENGREEPKPLQETEPHQEQEPEHEIIQSMLEDLTVKDTS